MLVAIAKPCYSWVMNAQILESDLRSKLIARRGEWASIAQVSGVSHSWISKFVNNHIPNPGLRTLASIQACLEAKSMADSASV